MTGLNDGGVASLHFPPPQKLDDPAKIRFDPPALLPLHLHMHHTLLVCLHSIMPLLQARFELCDCHAVVASVAEHPTI